MPETSVGDLPRALAASTLVVTYLARNQAVALYWLPGTTCPLDERRLFSFRRCTVLLVHRPWWGGFNELSL